MTNHISRHFDEQLDLLKEKLLRMGTLVEEAIARSVRALVEHNSDLAEDVIASDPNVDELELEIDTASLELLVLRQPVASDLRFIAASLKIVKDLERVGDLAVNIAERAIELNREPEAKFLSLYVTLAEAAQKMLKDSLDAFVNRDVELAQKVLYADDYVDLLNEKLFRDLIVHMAENSANIPRASNLMFVAMYLERLGDHASNVAEMVIFLVEARDVRHYKKLEQLRKEADERKE